MQTKSWWKSKTLWTNTIMLVLAFVTRITDVQIDGEIAVSIIAVVNFVLRLVTKEGLTA